jgi:hypothetical protein
MRPSLLFAKILSARVSKFTWSSIGLTSNTISDISGGFSFFFPFALAAAAAAAAAAAPSSSSSSPKRSRSSSSAFFASFFCAAAFFSTYGFTSLEAPGLRALVHSFTCPKAENTYGIFVYAENHNSTLEIDFLNPGSR